MAREPRAKDVRFTVTADSHMAEFPALQPQQPVRNQGPMRDWQ
jgi:hypothetical protein